MLIFIALVAVVAGVSTDCDRPPHVANARVNLVDDETGDLVSATYSCVAGFRLHGEAELFCDLDTDEWQGEPPACRAGIYRGGEGKKHRYVDESTHLFMQRLYMFLLSMMIVYAHGSTEYSIALQSDHFKCGPTKVRTKYSRTMTGDWVKVV